jgi:hypothetical protein
MAKYQKKSAKIAKASVSAWRNGENNEIIIISASMSGSNNIRNEAKKIMAAMAIAGGGIEIISAWQRNGIME